MWQSVHGALQAIGALLALQATQIQIPPPPRGFSPTAADVVQDAAHVLSPESVARIDQIAFDVHQKSGGEIVLVTLPDIGLRDPNDVGLAIGRAWGVGAQGKPGDQARNAGVVILLVPKETSSDGKGHAWIAVGRGAEGFLTDSRVASFVDEALPDLRDRDYSGAAVLLTERVAQRYAGEFGFTLDTALHVAAPARDVYAPTGGRGGLPPGLLLVIFVVVFFLLSSMGRRRRGCGGCIPIFIPPFGGGWGGGRGGWGGGGFGGGGGGGFGGFGGGGGFSGGGGGRSW